MTRLGGIARALRLPALRMPPHGSIAGALHARCGSSLTILVCIVLATACGGSKAKPTITEPERTELVSTADRILPLLPEGAQVIVEVDLARLRANPAVGALVTQIVTGDAPLAPLPDDVPRISLAHADTMVMASYGVGTSSAATVIVVATTPSTTTSESSESSGASSGTSSGESSGAPPPIPGAIPLADGLVVLGPAEWTAQVEARAAIAGITGANTTPTIGVTKDLRALRDHAMPAKAPGASLRITARLPFDARVALGRATGLETPPAQMSIWGDVVDDMVFIIDLDASDPGDRTKPPAKDASSATKRMEASLRGVLAGLANETAIRLVGLAPSLEGAEIVTRGSWVRAIIAVGPKRLGRVVERAKAFLATPPAAVSAPAL
ncbi:MAG: hypothetical protein ACKV2T_38295 [Kofleriaceae bacterium]